MWSRHTFVIPYDKKTRVEIECKLIRIVISELRLKGLKDKPSLQMDGLQEQRESLLVFSFNVVYHWLIIILFKGSTHLFLFVFFHRY